MSERREKGTAVVIQGCEVWTPGRKEPREGADIFIQDGRIVEVADTGSKPIPQDAQVIEGNGLLAIPGLVNAHSHSPENCLRGLGEGQALEPWLLHMFGGGGLFTPEDHYLCALAGAVEMLQLGITAVVDHLWMTPATPEAIDATMRAFRDAGIRAGVAPLMDDHDYTDELAESLDFDLGLARMSEHVGMLPANELISMLSDAFDRWHGEEDGRLRILAGPGGVQWASEELLTGLAETARSHGSGIHIHLLETPVQDAACRNRFGRSGVSALADLGVLGPDCSLPHSVWATPEDVEVIAEKGAIPVHNPAANLRLGSGRAPIPEFIDAGATVGLGTDGSASSDNQNLWEGIKLASFMHNDAVEDRWLTSERTLAMATKGGAAVLGLADELGEIKAGALADITLIDRYSDGLAGAVDVPAALAIAESGRGVRHVLVEGELVVEDGRLLTVDADAVRRELAEQSAARRAEASSPPEKTLRAIEDMKRFRKHLIQTSTTIGRK